MAEFTTPESIANGLTTGNQTETTVLRLANGRFLNFWLSTDGYYFKTFNADGSSDKLEQKLLDTTADGIGADVSVANFSDGSFVVVWTATDASGTGVYARRFDANGQALNETFRVNDTITSDQHAPVVTTFADNSYAVAWQSDGQGDTLAIGTKLDGIFAQRFNSQDQPLGQSPLLGEIKANHSRGDADIGDISDLGGQLPGITALANGNFLLVYQTKTTSNAGGDTIFAAIYGANGQLVNYLRDPSQVGNELQQTINTTDNTTTDTNKNPVATQLSNGSIVVAWQSSDKGIDGDDIFYRLYNADGTVLEVASSANTGTIYSQINPAIANLTGGGFVIVWQSQQSDTSYLGIYGQRFAADGTRVGNEFLVQTKVADSQQKPSVIGTSDGGFVVSWESDYQNGLNDSEILQQRFDASGTKLGLSVFGGAGNDTLNRGASTTPVQLDGAAGNDALTAGSANDTLKGGTGNDTLDGGAGNDVMIGGKGDDTYVIDSLQDTLIEQADEGTDTIQTVLASFTLPDNFENLTLTGTAGVGTGNALDNTLTGNTGNNTLNGGDGNDVLLGLAGNDALNGGSGNDQLSGDEGDDTLLGGDGNDVLTAGAGNDVLRGGAGIDVLDGGEGNDSIDGGDNHDVINGGAGDDTMFGGTGSDAISGGDGYDVAQFKGLSSGYKFITRSDLLFVTDIDSSDGDDGTDIINKNDVEALQFLGDSKTLPIASLTGDNTLNGTPGNDILKGYTGNDWLFGDQGNDQLSGGDGFDTALFNGSLSSYTLSATNNHLIVNGPDGIDTVQGDVENLRFTDTLAQKSNNISVTQEAIANTLTSGDQTYTKVQAYAGGFANYWLGPDGFYVRHFALDGTSTALETRVLDVANDKVSNDIAIATFNDGSFIAAWAGEDGNSTGLFVQRFDVTGKAVSPKFRANDTITDTQNKAAIALLSDGGYVVAWQSANQGDSIIDGVQYGGTPNQTGIFAQMFDANSQPLGGELKISRSGGGDPFAIALDSGKFIVGYEAIRTNIDRMTVYANVYNRQGNLVTTLHDLNLPYQDQADGTPYDPYDAVDDQAVVIQNADGSKELLSTTSDPDQINYSIESNVSGIGDSSGNKILNDLREEPKLPTGTTLEGGKSVVVWQAPIDPYLQIPATTSGAVAGGLGNIVYDRSIMLRLYDNASGQALTQEIKANSYTLYDQTQPAVAALKGGSFIVVWQSVLKDGSYLGIYGQRFNADGSKNGAEFQVNTKVADSQKAPSVTGLSDGGFVVSWVAEYQDGNQQGKYQNGLSGTEIIMQRYDKDGNKLGLSVAGSADNDTLNVGGSDALQMDGANGDDVLTSGNGIDTLRGGDGNDTLNGGGGNDFLIGGKGDDHYIVDDTLDTLVENKDEGNDSVETTRLSYTLPDNIENLILSGSANSSGTGNALANTLTGNSGDNTLQGGEGIDTLIGGLGNDVYLVDPQDVIIEKPNEGIDTVKTDLAGYTLLDNLENLILLGTANSTGTGNSLDNTLTGNSGNNTLDGGSGNDTLSGGTGNDTYVVDSLQDVVIENANEGNDSVQTALTGYSLPANVENLILTGSNAIAGTGNDLNNTLTGNSGNNTLDGGLGNDTLIGGLGDDVYVVDSLLDVVTEELLGGNDTVETALASYSLGTNVENLILVGTNNSSGTGNILDNLLLGNSGNNSLDGGAGNDTIGGGPGNDTLMGGAGYDVISGGTGTDTVQYKGYSSGYRFITRENKLYVTDIDKGDGDEGTDVINKDDVENLYFLEDKKTLQIANLTGNNNLIDQSNEGKFIQGYVGNDWLTGNLGNDTLSGGEGVDTAVFNGPLGGYKLSVAGGKLIVEDIVTTDINDGTDTVLGDVENLRFNPSGISTNLGVTQEAIANGLTAGNQTATSVQSYSGGYINYWLGPDGFYFRPFAQDGTATSIETKVLDVTNDKVSNDVTVATFSDGSFVLAWTGQDASSTGLYVQRFDVTGKAISPKFRANDTITDAQNKPAIGILSDGSYVVAWQSANQGDSVHSGVAFTEPSNQTGIFAQVFDKNSQAIGGELKISYSGGGDPFVNTLADGKFVVGYEAISSGTDRMTIFANLYNQQGNIITTLHDLHVPYADQADGTPYDPYDAVDDLALTGLISSGDPDQINYAIEPTDQPTAIKDASGRDITNELRQTAKNPVAVTLEGAGQTVVVWQAPVDPYIIPGKPPTVDYDRSIMLRLYDNATGQALTPEIKANSFTQYEQSQPAVAALKGGGFVVVWQSLLKDQSYLGIYGQRFDSTGQKVGAEFQINTKTADSQKDPSVTGLADGGFVVSWVAEYQDGNQQGKYQNGLSGTEIIQQRFDKDGNKLGFAVSGGADNDTIILGGTDSIQLDGAAGDDILGSGDGIDTLRGGDGNDSIDGGKGNDFLYGGAGDDRIAAGEGNDWIDGGSGSDTVTLLGSKLDYEIKKIGDRYTVRDLTPGYEGLNSIDTLVNVELLQFKVLTGPNDDGLLSLASFGNGNNIPGIDVSDPDTHTANDLKGTDKDDTLTGGNTKGPADTLEGGNGDDLYIALGNALVIYDTGGNDTLQLSTANVDLSQPYNYQVNKIKGLSYIENVELTGSKALNLTGNAVDNILIGNQAANVIKGGAGNDTIAGGNGNDKLTGNDGADVFLFQSALSQKNVDIITDFVSGTDKIRLSSAIFKGIDPNKDGTINFIAGPGIKAAEIDSASFIVYDTKTGNLYYDGAGTAAKLFAKLAAPVTTDTGTNTNTNTASTTDHWFGVTTGSSTTTPVGFGSGTNTTSNTGTTEVTTVGVKSFPALAVTDFDIFT